jgi:hypothetical protein
MKRWLLAIGALLGSAWTCAQADYVLIVCDLGVPKSKSNLQAGAPGMQGMMPGGGGMDGPGGGMQEMMRRMQGMGGPPGRMGGRMGGGEEGMQPGGGAGRFGGPGGRFGGGMNPFGGLQGLFGNPNLEEDDEDESSTLKVSAVIEVKRWLQDMRIIKAPGAAGAMNPGLNPNLGRGGMNPGSFGGPGGFGRGGMGGMGMGAGGGLAGATLDRFLKFQHQWGKTGLYNAGDIQWRKFDVPPVDARYKARKEVLKEKTPENLRELARWVLNNGKVDEFPKIMDDLASVDPDDSAVVAYKKVKTDMDRKITKDDPAAYYWQNKLGNYKVKLDSDKYPHYVLLYPSSSAKSDAPEVENRLKRLEENYRAFFYWFALKGKALPVPDQRLVAILVDKPEEYQDYRKAFDNIVSADDGFYARRENLVFFSATPLDEGYDALDKSMKDLWQGKWKRSALIDGSYTKGVDPQADAVTIVRNQVKTLLLQALESESELAAVSHDGTLQLASVTGLVPRAVSAPEWVQFGTGSFFETPKGAWWQGTGAPSHLYLKKFKDWEKNKKLDTPAETTLKKVITDEYFREARKLNQDAAWMKARTMTWALTYYLAEQHLDKLVDYYQQLGNLPRDMEFDEEILTGCFARAFKLGDKDNPNQPRSEALKGLAKDWYDYMSQVQLENGQALKEADEAQESKREKARAKRSAPAAEKKKEETEKKKEEKKKDKNKDKNKEESK